MTIREFFRTWRQRQAEKRYEREKARRELGSDPREAERAANRGTPGGDSMPPGL
jgi:hypothetical protein